jgi:hypothetical protein
MVLSHGNALISQRNFFLTMVKARRSVRQISSLLISKGNLHDLDFARFRQLSLSIGRFLPARPAERHKDHGEKDRQLL